MPSSLESALNEALEEGQFVYYYQPKVCLQDGRLSGVEALLRWMKPCGTMVQPADFLPEAESSGFIREISKGMLDRLLVDFVLIHELHPALVLSFNLTAQDFDSSEIVDRLRRSIGSLCIDPRYLQVELTETSLIHSSPVVRENIHALVEMGIALAMDDFGTGYSTIDVLSQWPFSVVKIHQGLVERVLACSKSMAIVKSCIYMAHQLGVKVVAEGIESAEVYDFLLHAGCTEGQGYWMGRPMPLDQLLEYLKQDHHWAGSPIGFIHMAQMDHLCWRRNFIEWVIARNFGRDPPPMGEWLHVSIAEGECDLDRWYREQGRVFRGMAAYDALDRPHRLFHAVCREIVEAVDKGANLAEIVDRLRHMMQWSGEVLTRLQELELEALLARSQSAIGQAPSDLPPPV